jgi:SNF2 family DNA or RNA helicase
MTKTYELFDYQRADVAFLEVAGSALLGNDMGLGKGPAALKTIERVDGLPALVVSPNSMKFTWALEAERWLPSAKPYVVDGTAAARKKLLSAASQDPSALVIINYEALRGHSRLAGYGSIALARCPECGGSDPKVTHTKCEVHPRELNVIPFKTVILDEAHRCKDCHSKQTRAAWAIGQGKTVTRRYALTGTAISGDPSDLWSILHFLAPDEHPTKTKFVDRYCVQAFNAWGGLDVKGLHPATREEFYRVIDPRFRRMPKDLVLSQLPPKVRSTRFVELTPKQRKAYDELETGLVTRLPDGNVLVASNDLEAQVRLLQFASGTMERTFVPLDYERALQLNQAHRAGGKGELFTAAELAYVRETGFHPRPTYRMCDPSSKVDALVDILEELGDKPVLVSAAHRQLINLAAARLDKLKIQHGLLVGGQQAFERQATLRDFQAGKLRVLLFTLAAGGTGLTLTAADTQVRLQRSWSLIENLQAEDRNHRIGSEIHSSIHYVDVVARGTVEEVQLERLWEKTERLEEINRDRARLQLERRVTDELDAELARLEALNLGEVSQPKEGDA